MLTKKDPLSDCELTRKKKTKTSSINKPTTTTSKLTKKFRHVLPMAIDKRRRESPKQMIIRKIQLCVAKDSLSVVSG